METQMIWNLVLVAMIPLGILIYHWYMKVTAVGSPGGRKITKEEWKELIQDDDFLDYVLDIVDAILSDGEEDAVQE